MNKIAVVILFFVIIIYGAERATILYTGIDDSRVMEFATKYNTQLRQIWGAESDITLISSRIVEQLKYNSTTDQIEPDEHTKNYLANRGISSTFMVIPYIEKYEVEIKNHRVVVGQAVGELDIRFTIVDLETGSVERTSIIKADTTMTLGNTMLRSADKATYLSVDDRETINRSLTNSSVEQSFDMIRLFVDSWLEKKSQSEENHTTVLSTETSTVSETEVGDDFTEAGDTTDSVVTEE